MGTIQHHALLVTSSSDRDAEYLRSWIGMLPDNHRRLFVEGPKMTNGYITFVCLPDGSKEGWGASNSANDLRQELIDLLENQKYDDGSNSYEWALCSYGELGAHLVESNQKSM